MLYLPVDDAASFVGGEDSARIRTALDTALQKILDTHGPDCDLEGATASDALIEGLAYAKQLGQLVDQYLAGLAGWVLED